MLDIFAELPDEELLTTLRGPRRRGRPGYDPEKLWPAIRKQYHARPIIDPNPGHKRAYAKTEKTAEWKMIYNRRISIERLNGRLKGHRKLNHVRVRGHLKVSVHAMLSIIVCQAQALATGTRASVRKVA